MGAAYALLRAGYPYVRTLGMRRITSNPVMVAVGAEGRLYVLCRGDISTDIRRTSIEDEDLGTISGAGTADGKFIWPTALVLDGDGNLVFCDEALHRISTITTEGQFVSKWGEQGDGDGQLNRPSGMALDGEGNVYIADTLNHRIQKFTRDGRFLLKWGAHGSGEGEFNMPWGVTVDEQGDVYVADWRNDRVQKFTGEGRFLFSFGGTGSEYGQFNRPSGVTVDKDGDIYVADPGNNRIQLFNPDGRYVEQFIGDATLSRCARDYLLPNAKPLRLREMAWLEPQKRFKSPVSCTVDADGRLYVPDYGCHRVQIYQKEAYRLEPDQIIPPLRSPTLMTT
jgi:DNA-binding beta-propeller fold protein YncE